MKAWLHRIRGVLGTALTRAAGWAGLGGLLGFVVPGWSPFAALTLAFVGLYTGAAFAVLLGISERRRTLEELSLPKVAIIGAVVAVGVLALSMGSGTPAGIWLSYQAVGGLVGAGSAAGSLALARRSEDKELLEAGEEALGLTEGG